MTSATEMAGLEGTQNIDRTSGLGQGSDPYLIHPPYHCRYRLS